MEDRNAVELEGPYAENKVVFGPSAAIFAVLRVMLTDLCVEVVTCGMALSVSEASHLCLLMSKDHVTVETVGMVGSLEDRDQRSRAEGMTESLKDR